MPYVNITTSAPLSSDQTARLQRDMTRLLADSLHKRPELTVVTITRAAASDWSSGGASVDVADTCAVLAATITAGTNTESEKAEFIAAADQLLREVLGPINVPLYVLLQELPAMSWGYNGCTQAARRTMSARL